MVWSILFRIYKGANNKLGAPDGMFFFILSNNQIYGHMSELSTYGFQLT